MRKEEHVEGQSYSSRSSRHVHVVSFFNLGALSYMSERILLEFITWVFHIFIATFVYLSVFNVSLLCLFPLLCLPFFFFKFSGLNDRYDAYISRYRYSGRNFGQEIQYFGRYYAIFYAIEI